MLYVRKAGISQKALNRIKRLAAFRNPDFYRSQAMRLPIYDKPRIISCSEETKEYMLLPRGCEDSLLELIRDSGTLYNVTDKRTEIVPISVKFNGELRPEQQRAADAMLTYYTGVLSATTAFGKTVVASYMICARKCKTLILVHSTALLQQWKKSLSEFIIFEDKLPEQPVKRGRRKKASHIGQIGAGKSSLSGIVDIAIMQSVIRDNEVKPFVKDYSMVIVDECHHVSAFSFEKILKEINAKYVYGLTATPKRQDGHQLIITMQCGPIRYVVDAKTQITKNGFEHYVIPEFTNFRIADNTLKYQEICSLIAADEMRNEQIVKDVTKAYFDGRNPIVLTERTEHAELMYSLISARCSDIFLLSGKDKMKDKREKLEQIKVFPQDKNIVIVATGKYIGEGFDEPRLDTLFLTMPISWKGTLAQYAGRLHRNCEGKSEVCIHDYADIFVPMLDRMYHKRISGYSELGYRLKGSDNNVDSIVYTALDYRQKHTEDIRSSVKSVVISSPKINVNMLRSFHPVIPDSVEFTLITSSDITQISSVLSDNINIIHRDNTHQIFTVIDDRIVWYGSISPLMKSYDGAAVIRLVNTSLAGKLTEIVKDGFTLI